MSTASQLVIMQFHTISFIDMMPIILKGILLLLLDYLKKKVYYTY
jgi:hypothetical protein